MIIIRLSQIKEGEKNDLITWSLSLAVKRLVIQFVDMI